jgi:hypothetical protein
MKRLLTTCLLTAVACTWLNQTAAISSAQDITITITKKDKKDKKDKQSDKKQDAKAAFKGKRPSVDVAILLDTSNSMDGLIDQAKSQLWNIVQEFAAAKKKGKTPILRVSVFEYGNTNLPAGEGYIRQVVQLTDDLDKVSEALFGLTTNGGDEYCGMVVNEAVKRLDWSGEPNAYKAIFIAGNEPFTQGEVSYKSSCKKAIGDGIVVNTIHCGDYKQGVSGKWKHAAEIAEGEYLNINQDKQVVHIKCPQDKIIIKLNRELNETYLWYGAAEEREGYSSNQTRQDSNALSAGSSSGRALAKSSALYRNFGRDLVDTMEEDADILSGLAPAKLPEALQNKSKDEIKQHVSEMGKRRAEIKKKMAVVAQERAVYMKAERAKLASGADGQDGANETGEATLGDAFSSAVQKQLQASGFELEK